MREISPVAVFLVFFLSVSFLPAQEVDEASLFADTASVTQTPLAAQDSASQVEKKTTGVSGSIVAAATAGFPRDDWKSPDLYSEAVGNLLLDARLTGGIKGFANAEARYSPSRGDSADFILRELFVDFNAANRAYFRAGKQVLQWGRCYLWNPTDLINVDRKSAYVADRIGSRDGAYGLKAHVPFGTRVNLYAFADARRADSLEKTAGAFKAEFTVKGTEMAAEVWGRKGKKPVFGYDISSRLLQIDIAAEAALFRQDDERRMIEDAGVLKLVKGPEDWTPRAALNFSRSFDVSGIPDRLTVVLEGYYNGAGYNSRIFQDTAKYRYEGDMQNIAEEMGFPMPPGFESLLIQQKEPVTKLQYFLMNGLYRPNEHAPYYAALFATFNRFINSNMSLFARSVFNVGERCAIIMGGINYLDLRDLSVGLTVTGYAGPKLREYTLFGRALDIRLNAGIAF